MSQTDLAPVEQSYKQVVMVAVPRSTVWQPKAAHQLMVSIFGLSDPVMLGIEARANHIQWYLETRCNQVEALVNTLYALYPQAQIEVQPKTNAHIGYYLFDLHTAAPFIAPLKMAEDFGGLDPLPSVVSALSRLGPDEAILYELYLTGVEAEYYQLGEKLITASTVQWWNFLHPAGAILAATRKLTGTDKVEKYVPEIQKPARAKLNSPLQKVIFSLKVKAATPERAYELVQLLFPALAIFEREGLNYLTAPYDKSFTPILTAGEVAALWHLPTEHCQTPGIVWAGSAAAPLPSPLINQEEGLILGTNTFQGHQHTVRLSEADRVTHINLIGKTGVGKSTLLFQMIRQDIATGKGVAVIDPHGDLVDTLLSTSIPPERESDVVLLDTRDTEFAIGLNLLASLPGLSPEVTAGYALAVMRKLLAEQWSGQRMETILDAALRVLVEIPNSTIRDIPKLLLDAKFRRQALKQVSDLATRDYWRDEFDQESVAQQREMARPITYRLRKFYRDPMVRRMICQTSSLDFRHLLDQQKIFLACLGGIAETEADTVGALLISKIQMAALSRAGLAPEQRKPFYLYVDEVQNFVTTSLYEVLSEARKYGLSLVVANQYLKQLEGETLSALMGNVGTTVIFAVGPPDAQALIPYVKPDFGAADLVNLDRFATVVKLQLNGRTLPAFSLVTPPPPEKPADARERLERIREYSRRTYARPAAEIEAELMSQADQESSDDTTTGYFD